MSRLGWERIGDSSVMRVYKEMTFLAGETHSILLHLPADTVEYAYGVSIETGQSQGTSFRIEASTLVTVNSLGTPILNIGAVNGLHGIPARTLAYYDSDVTFLTGPGIPDTFVTLLGTGAGQSKFEPFSQDGTPLAILPNNTYFFLQATDTQNSAGTYFVSFLIDEVQLPASSHQL